MATVYTWSFPQLDVVPSEDGLTDVVQTIHWRLTAVDGQYSAGAYGTVTVGPPNPQSFILYQQLTEAEVQQWTVDTLGQEQVDLMMANIQTQIDNQINPPIVPMNPPWVSE